MAKISQLPLLQNPTGAENVVVFDGDLAKRVPLAPLIQPLVGTGIIDQREAALNRVTKQSFFADPEYVGNGWNGHVEQTSVDGRTAVVIDSQNISCSSRIPASVAIGDEFTIGFTLEEITALAGAAEIYVVYPIDNYDHRLVSSNQSVVGPTRYTITLVRLAGQDVVNLYISCGGAGNRIVLSQVGAYPDGSDAERPALNGIEPMLTDLLGEQAAIAELARHPNAWPDMLSTGLMADGWNADVPALATTNGRPYYHIAGTACWIDIALEDVGEPGEPFAMCARVRAHWAGNFNNAVYARFIRADGTVSDTTQQLADELGPLGSRNIAVWRRLWLVGTIPADAAGLQIYSAAQTEGSYIDLSLPSVHGGRLPYWRSGPLVTASNGGGTTLVGVTNATRPASALADTVIFNGEAGEFQISDGAGNWAAYSASGTGSTPTYDYYVSPTGSDAGTGTLAQPFATPARAAAAVGTQVGKRIGLLRGGSWRKMPLSCNADDLLIGAYGDAMLPEPELIGSEPFTVFTAESTGVYSLPAAIEPRGCFLRFANGSRQKLYLTEDPALFAVVDPWLKWRWDGAAQKVLFQCFSGIVGATLEVSTLTTADLAVGINVSGARPIVQQIACRGWPDQGSNNNSEGPRFLDCLNDYNCGDGIDGSVATRKGLIRGGSCSYNGRGWGMGGGPGDAWSGHNTNDGYTEWDVEFVRSVGNTQTGSGNQYGCRSKVRWCVMQDNETNLNVYGGGIGAGQPRGYHLFAYNLLIHRLRARPHITNGGGSFADATMLMHNNTMWTAPSLPRTFAPISLNGIEAILRNNIVDVPSDYAVSAPAGSVNSDFNIFKGHAAISRADAYSWTPGASDLFGDPQLFDPAAGIFIPRPTSPAIGTGAPLGYTADVYGRAVPGNPDRGAVQRV